MCMYIHIVYIYRYVKYTWKEPFVMNDLEWGKPFTAFYKGFSELGAILEFSRNSKFSIGRWFNGYFKFQSPGH